MPVSINHVWKPSSARLATIDSFVPVARGTAAVAPPPLNWATKDPGDVLDYTLDIGPAIVGNDGDGISTLTIAISPSNPGDLELQSSTADGSRAVLWLSGGQTGVIYTVTFSITTLGGRSLQRSVLLPVLLLSVPVIPDTAIITSAGIVLTDQNGNPILTRD